MNRQHWMSACVLGFVVVAAPPVALGGERPDDQEVQQLVQKLKSKDLKERAEAADELCSIGKEAKAAVPALIELNMDKEWYVRTRAVMAMSAIGKDLKGEGPKPRRSSRRCWRP